MLTQIKKLEVNNFSFTKELYILLNSSEKFLDLKLHFNNIISLQRSLFTLNYGTLEQIGYYLLNNIKDDSNKQIEILDIHTLLEYLIFKFLLKDVTYKLNINLWFEQINVKNNKIYEDFSQSLKVTSENISHFNVINLVEIIDKFYLPDRYDVLCNITNNLVNYYNSSMLLEFEPKLYLAILGDLSLLNNYLNDNIEKILSQEYNLNNLEIIRHPIFFKDNFVEIFLDKLKSKSETEFENAIKTLGNGITNTHINEIYLKLLKFSETVINIGNHKLTSEFQDFTKFLNSILTKTKN